MQLNFILFCCVLLFSAVFAEGDNEVKRGQYPFASFIYYTDESVVDETGKRFFQSAVLIRPDWLVTMAIEETLLAFPQKTLVARAGAVTIDANLTFNEDEEEQEREIIEIIIPRNRSDSQLWFTDMILLKTLLPFNITSAVSNMALQTRREISEKPCSILVFVKKDANWMEDKILMQFSVDIKLPSSKETCGDNFVEETMVCALDSDEKRNSTFPHFCHGNKGGPLICEEDVMGLQTYMGMDCNQPYLFQLLSAWDNFITCGAEEKCSEDQCSKICVSINKDLISSSSKYTVTFTESSSQTTTEGTSDTEAAEEEPVTVEQVVVTDSNFIAPVRRTNVEDVENVTEILLTSYKTVETTVPLETLADLVSSTTKSISIIMENITESTTVHVDLRKQFEIANETTLVEQQTESPAILSYKKGDVRKGTGALRYSLINLLFCIYAITFLF